MTDRLSVDTEERVEVMDITSQVEERIDIENGLCVVYIPHTTAGVTINEGESRLLEDIEDALRDLIPRTDGYRHDEIDNNADAHLRSMLLSTSVVIPVIDGSSALGTWQSVLFFEGDGPRNRDVIVSCIER